MRICYNTGDERARVAEVTRVKFLPDGFQKTDRNDEIVEGLTGPIIVVHAVRPKGGKRLIFGVSDGFDMEAAKNNLLRYGFLDLSACPFKMENLYT